MGSSMASQQNIDEEEEEEVVQSKEAPQKDTQAERSVNKKHHGGVGGGGRKGINPPHHRSTRSTLVSQCSMGEWGRDQVDIIAHNNSMIINSFSASRKWNNRRYFHFAGRSE